MCRLFSKWWCLSRSSPLGQRLEPTTPYQLSKRPPTRKLYDITEDIEVHTSNQLDKLFREQRGNVVRACYRSQLLLNLQNEAVYHETLSKVIVQCNNGVVTPKTACKSSRETEYITRDNNQACGTANVGFGPQRLLAPQPDLNGRILIR